MADHQGVILNVRLPDGDISYEAQDIRNGDYFSIPFTFRWENMRY